MADKDTDEHQQDAEVKLDKTEDTHLESNQKENDPEGKQVKVFCKQPQSALIHSCSSNTDEKGISECEDASPQSDCESELPTEGPGLNKDGKETEENPGNADKDRGDGQKTETQQEVSSNIRDSDVDNCEELDGSPPGSNEESEEDSGTTPPNTEGIEETVEAQSEKPELQMEAPSEKPEPHMLLPQETSSTEPMLSVKNIQTIGPKLEEPTPVSEVSTSLKADKRRYWIAVVLVVLVGVLFQQLLQPESPPTKKEVSPVDIFHREMKKVMFQFPSQREELWKRSKIHLQRHFQVSHPTEPVSLILTAGVGAERTLRCLAHSLASALSSALNSSILHIDGASKASQDSDQVKMDIDNQLQTAFKGDKPVAVINRFEELPPASTIIFYRYCDHENAAFKKTFLIFTILLGEEEEIPAKIRLNAVEELVNDHLQKKFLSHGHPTAFDKMDIDKYAGLWSRISHLILPVVTEKNTHC